MRDRTFVLSPGMSAPLLGLGLRGIGLGHTYIHTNLYSAKNRENESEAMDRCSCGSSGTLGAITLHPLKSARKKYIGM